MVSQFEQMHPRAGAGRFTEKDQADPGTAVIATTKPKHQHGGDQVCVRCHRRSTDGYMFAGLCTDCAEDSSECPDCGMDTSGLNPAQNGCPNCGGGQNDCEMCGSTGCATYRDDDRILCDDCYDQHPAEEPDDYDEED